MANRQYAGLTTRSLALTDIFASQDAGGAVEAGKATITSLATLIGVLESKTSVSSAEILLLNGTPKTLVAAPGAGFFIKPISIIVKFLGGGVAYTTNVTLYTNVGGMIFGTNGTTLGNTGDFNAFINPASTTQSGSFPLENAALQLSVLSGNPAAGNGTMVVYVSYVIIPV